MHHKVQAGICVRAGGQAGRYNYLIRPSFDSFLYGIIKLYILCCPRRKDSKDSKTNKQTKKEGAGA